MWWVLVVRSIIAQLFLYMLHFTNTFVVISYKSNIFHVCSSVQLIMHVLSHGNKGNTKKDTVVSRKKIIIFSDINTKVLVKWSNVIISFFLLYENTLCAICNTPVMCGVINHSVYNSDDNDFVPTCSIQET